MFSVACKCLGAGEKVTALPACGDRQTAAQTIGSLSRNLGKRADPEAAFPCQNGVVRGETAVWQQIPLFSPSGCVFILQV